MFTLLLVIVVLSVSHKVLHGSGIGCVLSTSPFSVKLETRVPFPASYQLVRSQPDRTNLLPATVQQTARAEGTE